MPKKDNLCNLISFFLLLTETLFIIPLIFQQILLIMGKNVRKQNKSIFLYQALSNSRRPLWLLLVVFSLTFKGNETFLILVALVTFLEREAFFASGYIEDLPMNKNLGFLARH